jgi:hypothetical protein
MGTLNEKPEKREVLLPRLYQLRPITVKKISAYAKKRKKSCGQIIDLLAESLL